MQEHADSLASWVSAGGTILAAIVALGIALREQRNAGAERRDRDAGQARCVTVALGHGKTLEITNHSQLPVHWPQIESMGNPRLSWDPRIQIDDNQDYFEVLPRNTTYRVRWRYDLKMPSSEHPLDADNVTITFMDAAGLRWRRTGRGDPLRIGRPSPKAKLDKANTSTGEAVRGWLVSHSRRLRLRQ